MALLQSLVHIAAASVLLYLIFVATLTIPFVQNQVIYLNGITLTWFQDVNFPEQWGFLHNQVTPFNLETRDKQVLHAWHILPLELYRQHEQRLKQEPDGLRSDVTQSFGFELLRDDPDSLLVLYFHGAAGTLGSGWRPQSYRAIYAGAPGKIHTVAIDYRGFGSSTGAPSEAGLLTDAITLAEWAMNVANISPSRIVLFGQSLGTAVSMSLAHHFATRADPIFFSGLVLVAPMADVQTLTATYRVAGTVPILEPFARFPKLLIWLNTFIRSKWPSRHRLAEMVTLCEASTNREAKYHIVIVHAEDDYDIPWSHSDLLFHSGTNAARADGISFEGLEQEKQETRENLGAGGWAVTMQTEKGVLKERILKHGLHDRIMSYPVVSIEVLQAFQSMR